MAPVEAQLQELGVRGFSNAFFIPETSDRYEVLEQLCERLLSCAEATNSKDVHEGAGARADAISSLLCTLGLDASVELVKGTGDRLVDEQLLQDLADACTRLETGLGQDARSCSSSGTSQLLQAAAVHVRSQAGGERESLFRGAPELARVFKECSTACVISSDGGGRSSSPLDLLTKKLPDMDASLRGLRMEMEAVQKVEAGSCEEHASAAQELRLRLRGLSDSASNFCAVFDAELKPWVEAGMAASTDAASGASRPLPRDQVGGNAVEIRQEQARLAAMLRALATLRSAHAALKGAGSGGGGGGGSSQGLGPATAGALAGPAALVVAGPPQHNQEEELRDLVDGMHVAVADLQRLLALCMPPAAPASAGAVAAVGGNPTADSAATTERNSLLALQAADPGFPMDWFRAAATPTTAGLGRLAPAADQMGGATPGGVAAATVAN